MLPCRSSGHPSGCEWLRVSANCRRGRPQLAARGRNLKKNTFPTKPLFFKMLPCHSSGHSSGCFTRNGHLRPLAAHTPVASQCSHWPQVAASPTTASCSQLQPTPAAIRSHSQPLEWPQVAAATRSHLQPLEWPQVAAPATRKWPQVAAPLASGRKWPQVAAVARQIRASGRKSKWPQVAASGRSRQIRASGRKWPRVAAFGQINFHPQSLSHQKRGLPWFVYQKSQSTYFFRATSYPNL